MFQEIESSLSEFNDFFYKIDQVQVLVPSHLLVLFSSKLSELEMVLGSFTAVAKSLKPMAKHMTIPAGMQKKLN